MNIEELNNRPDLVNLSNSILRHYGCEPFHDSIKELDDAIKGHRKIAVFLFDGLGQYVLNKNKEESRYILSHKFKLIYSVNPPTTAAATTAFLTGKYPIETGWLGWAPYQKELGYPVELFTKKNRLTDVKLSNGWEPEKAYPIKRITNILNEHGVKAELHMKKGIGFLGETPKGAKNLKQRIKWANEFFHEGGEFLYSYDSQPDGTIHKLGVSHRKVKSYIKKITKYLKRFVRDNPDVLVMSIADHGLLDIEFDDLANYPDLTSLLRLPLSNENRCCCFYVKQGKGEEFVPLFNKYFPDFILETKEDILAKGYFGEGVPLDKALDEIGDYVAVATRTRLLWNSKETPHVTPKKAHHAGGTMEEKEICLSLYNL